MSIPSITATLPLKLNTKESQAAKAQFRQTESANAFMIKLLKTPKQIFLIILNMKNTIISKT